MGKSAKPPPQLVLKSGHFYEDKEGCVWCCYQVDTHEGFASTICLLTDKQGRHHLDGRTVKSTGSQYDRLVREIDFKDAWIDETYEVRTRIHRP